MYCVVRNVFAIAGALLVLVLFFPPYWYARLLSGEWCDPKGDILVVLAGDTLEPEILGESSYWRAVYAVRAWRDGGFSRVIISGDSAPSMRDFLLASNVPAEAIVLEASSHSTRENAVNTSRQLMQLSGRAILLTSDYHMYRAVRAFRRAGAQIEPRPFPDALKRLNTWRLRWGVTAELLIETAKILYYRWQGWL